MSESLVDATKLFARRRAEAEAFNRQSTTFDIEQAVTTSTANLLNEVQDISPQALDALKGDQSRLTIKIVTQVDDDEGGPSASMLDTNQVHYSPEGLPSLNITQEYLDEISGILSPYFEHSDEPTDKGAQLAIALGVAVRTGVAAWLFDGIDPRITDESEERSIQSAALEVGLEGLIHDPENIDAAMDVLRFRLIGYLGFAELLNDPKFQTVQQVFEAYFDQGIESDALADKSFSARFAFAHMLSRREAHELIERLVRINQVIAKYT